jgi:hypothetical protein
MVEKAALCQEQKNERNIATFFPSIISFIIDLHAAFGPSAMEFTFFSFLFFFFGQTTKNRFGFVCVRSVTHAVFSSLSLRKTEGNIWNVAN